jgi:hypothetical protein
MSDESGRGRENPGARYLARAECRFEDQSEQHLHATELSLGGAFLRAMDPRPVGQSLSVTFHPTGLSPLPAIRALIIACTIDPRSPERSGLRVIFTDLDGENLSLLVATLGALGLHDGRPAVTRGERRVCPRVRTPFMGTIEHPAESVPVRILDLSMSGALLGPGPEQDGPLPPMGLGSELMLHIFAPKVPEPIDLRALVVRFAPGAGPGSLDGSFGIGVVFVGLQGAMRGRLEVLLLDTLASG